MRAEAGDLTLDVVDACCDHAQLAGNRSICYESVDDETPRSNLWISTAEQCGGSCRDYAAEVSPLLLVRVSRVASGGQAKRMGA
jgi:hypothetical protein